MKKIFRKRRTVVVIALAVLLLVSYLVYSRPMTLSQLFPLRDIDQCIGISGYYRTSTQTDGITQFAIEPGSEEFQELCRLFNEKTYRRSLRGLLARGVRTQPITDKFEFEWEVMFHFDTIAFPDGNAGSGPLLRVQYWYGELDIENVVWKSVRRSYHTREQDAWAREILDCMR